MAGQGERTAPDYLYRRKGSPNWRLKFQYPSAELREFASIFWMETALATGEGFFQPVRAVEDISLGTSDRNEARAITAVTRHLHEMLMIAWQQARDPTKYTGAFFHEYIMKPGTNRRNEDGSLDIATESEITTVFTDGRPQETRRNSVGLKIELFAEYLSARQKRIIADGQTEIRRTARKDVDTEIVEAYVAHAKLRKDDADGTFRTLADWKEITENKAFTQATRGDAQDLVDHLLEERDLSPARTKKLIAFLKAAINHEIETKPRGSQRVSWNPFVKLTIVGADGEGETKRPPFSEAEIARIKAHLHIFNDQQRLMLVWHLSTGIRPGGIYSICADAWEEGEDEAGNKYQTRHVRITKDKGKFGPRNLPIPQAVLDLRREDGTPILPEKIEGPLFDSKLNRLIQDIGKKLKAIGVLEREGVCLYSGRHRAIDRLLNRSVGDELRYAIMGHTRQGAHHRYGHGFNMFVLKSAIDKIGL